MIFAWGLLCGHSQKNGDGLSKGWTELSSQLTPSQHYLTEMNGTTGCWVGISLSSCDAFSWLSWASSQHGGLSIVRLVTWQLISPRACVLRDQGRSCKIFYNPVFEVTQGHFHWLRLVIQASLDSIWEGLHRVLNANKCSSWGGAFQTDYYTLPAFPLSVLSWDPCTPRTQHLSQDIILASLLSPCSTVSAFG